LRYKVNALGGSSGSPCFNADWELIAVHHVGDPKYYSQFGDWNEGIPIMKIVEHLRSQDMLEYLS
jgi:V8-like Glu-specific endopeptidase